MALAICTRSILGSTRRSVGSSIAYLHTSLPAPERSARPRAPRPVRSPEVRSAAVAEAASTITTPSETYVDPKQALHEAKSRAWYLQDEEDAADSSPWIKGNTPRRRPKFITFDPNRTTEDVTEEDILPLPENAPELLRPLYDWMTSDDASDVLDISSVRFICTKNAPEWAVGEGSLIQSPDGDGPRGTWDWVIVAVVKGYGKGVIGRAERAVRVWLHKNPIGRLDTERGGKRPKLPRVPEDTDWSLIGIPERNVCINLFTMSGRERWDLEGLWAGTEREKEQHKFGLPLGFQAEQAK